MEHFGEHVGAARRRARAHDSGLRSDSIVLCEQLRTLEKRRLRERAGQIDGLALRRVDAALRAALGLM